MKVFVQVSGRSALARHALVACMLVIAYLSLFPFSGWRYQGMSLAAFLNPPWARQFYTLDVILNVAGYVPLGLLMVLVVHPRPAWQGLVAALFGGLCLSAFMEGLQGFLPVRVASPVDLLANGAGALLGGLLGVWLKPWLMHAGGVHLWRDRWFRRGADIDFALVLLVLWPLTQFLPGSLPLATGDLRGLLAAPTGTLHPALAFVLIDGVVALGHTLVLGLLAALVLAPGRTPFALILMLVVMAFVSRALALAWFTANPVLPGFLTPGALAGLVIGAVLLIGARHLGRSSKARLALCVLCLVTLFLNLAPLYPYPIDPVAGRYPVYESSLRGLAALVSRCWPLLAAGFLVQLLRRGEGIAGSGSQGMPPE
jgi:VanZ family protein